MFSESTGASSCTCEPARKPSLDQRVTKPKTSAVKPADGVTGARQSSDITATSATTPQDGLQPNSNAETEVSIPELIVDFDTRIPKPIDAFLGPDGIVYVEEVWVTDADNEERGKDDGCSYSDGAGSLAGSVVYDSDDDALTKTTGVQTDEGDARVSTYSTFVCLLTRDGAATQVAHNLDRPPPTEIPDTSAKSSKKWTLSYLVY